MLAFGDNTYFLSMIAITVLWSKLSSSQNITIDTNADAIFTVANTEGPVYHIEIDQSDHRTLLYSDGNSLKSGNSTIVGKAIPVGYVEGLGEVARFCRISSFVQLSATNVLVVDLCNHCLRFVDRNSRNTTRFAGTCTVWGFGSGADSARFASPHTIIVDRKTTDQYIISDTNNNALRTVDSQSGLVLTKVQDTAQMVKPTGLVQELTSGDIYITTDFAVVKYSYKEKTISSVAGSVKSGFADGLLEEAQFNRIFSITFLSPHELIVSGYDNNRLRILNLQTNTTRSICSGEAGHDDGTLTTCKLLIPQALLVVNSTLYIGQSQRIRAIQGHPTGEQTKRSEGADSMTSTLTYSSSISDLILMTSPSAMVTGSFTPDNTTQLLNLMNEDHFLSTTEIIIIVLGTTLLLTATTVAITVLMKMKRKKGNANPDENKVYDDAGTPYPLPLDQQREQISETLDHDYEDIDNLTSSYLELSPASDIGEHDAKTYYNQGPPTTVAPSGTYLLPQKADTTSDPETASVVNKSNLDEICQSIFTDHSGEIDEKVGDHDSG